MTRKRRRVPRGRIRRRREYGRRKSDAYYTIGRAAGLIGFPATAIYAQAEMIAEPWRHLVGVAAIIGTVVWAYGTKPDFMSTLARMMRGKWLK